jgi:CheY-like chemotaxis protein
MQMRHKILLVDDDQDLLDLYQEILAQLPSHPEISTSSNGARAMAMLESEPFTLLVCDLNMPKMDGLQVLSIVRRKYPELRTVVLTSVMDEQFRSRVYGLGVDLFWQKPGSGEEIKQFIDCIESLLGREIQAGFRGVQSKSLVDIIQLECISHNSTLLKIINGPLTGRIWILDGDIIDAETEDLKGEAAFHLILSWKTGSFESLAAEPAHPRVINNSYQGLLLETAQAQDEAMSQAASSPVNGHSSDNGASASENGPSSALLPLARFEGVEFVMALKSDAKAGFEARGLENPQPMADWSRKTLENLQTLGDRLQAGMLQECECMGPQQNVALARQQTLDFCIGWQRDLSASEIRESMKKVLTLWVS